MSDVNNSPGKLQISPEMIFDFTAEDLEDMGEIGRGNFGSVNKMLHIKTSTVMAVKVFNKFNLFSPLHTSQ